MVDYPCECPDCGHRFFLPDFITGSGNIEGLTVTGNVVPCPQCHQPANMLNGVWDYGGEVLTLLSQPDRTLEELIRIREDLQRLAQAPASDQTAEAVASVAPELANVVAKQPPWMQIQVLLAALSFLVNLMQYRAS